MEQLQRLQTGDEVVISLQEEFTTIQTRSPETGSEDNFFQFMNKEIERKKAEGRLRTAETYTQAFRKLSTFLDGKKLKLSALTPELMEQYQSYLRDNDMAMNTISFQMRILRAVYNRVVEQGLTVDKQPFKNVYTGQARTVKRALTKQALQHMYRLKLTKPRLALARDMFLLSYYMHGMSFIDMAYLKPTNIYKGMLSYKRHKTGQIVELRWEQQMQEIVERYPNSSGLYLLPFITKQNDKERNQYRHYQFVVNHNLKEIGQEIGLEVPLTMYMARHTWATLAHDMDIPLSVISRAMGHTSEKTTEIYIRSVDRNTIDQANVRLINSVVGNSNGHYIE